MSAEIFFSFPENHETVESLKRLGKITSMYKTSSRNGRYVIGTSDGDYRGIPEHDGLKNLKFRIGFEIESSDREYSAVSVLSLSDYSDKTEYFTKDLKRTDDGLVYERTVSVRHRFEKRLYMPGMVMKTMESKPVKASLSSRISKMSLSEKIERLDDPRGSLRQQFMVMGFTGAPSSSSKITDYMASAVGRKTRVLDVHKFSVMDKLI